jgi:putative redox protein
MTKPPTVAELHWQQHGLVFLAQSAGREMTMDGDSQAGPSPVQMLAFALAGCTSSDVVYTLKKGRHPLRGLHVHLTAERAQENPHRILSVLMRFVIEGEVPGEAIDRAIALSRDKYCSVWHSMREDITLTVTWEKA